MKKPLSISPTGASSTLLTKDISSDLPQGSIIIPAWPTPLPTLESLAIQTEEQRNATYASLSPHELKLMFDKMVKESSLAYPNASLPGPSPLKIQFDKEEQQEMERKKEMEARSEEKKHRKEFSTQLPLISELFQVSDGDDELPTRRENGQSALIPLEYDVVFNDETLGKWNKGSRSTSSAHAEELSSYQMNMLTQMRQSVLKRTSEDETLDHLSAITSLIDMTEKCADLESTNLQLLAEKEALEAQVAMLKAESAEKTKELKEVYGHLDYGFVTRNWDHFVGKNRCN